MKPTNELKRYIKWCSKAIESNDVNSETIEEYGNEVFERIQKFFNSLKNCSNCRYNHKTGWKKHCFIEKKGKYCYDLKYCAWKKEK